MPLRCSCGSAKCASTASAQLVRNHDPGTHPDALEEIRDVVIVHANAAGRDKAADGAWLIRPMNRELVISEQEGGGSHGIVRSARGDDKVWPAGHHVLRRRPGWTNELAHDARRAKPLLAGAAHSDRVSDGSAFADDEIE